jgi:hypothetical protein
MGGWLKLTGFSPDYISPEPEEMIIEGVASGRPEWTHSMDYEFVKDTYGYGAEVAKQAIEDVDWRDLSDAEENLRWLYGAKLAVEVAGTEVKALMSGLEEAIRDAREDFEARKSEED